MRWDEIKKLAYTLLHAAKVIMLRCHSMSFIDLWNTDDRSTFSTTSIAKQHVSSGPKRAARANADRTARLRRTRKPATAPCRCPYRRILRSGATHLSQGKEALASVHPREEASANARLTPVATESIWICPCPSVVLECSPPVDLCLCVLISSIQ